MKHLCIAIKTSWRKNLLPCIPITRNRRQQLRKSIEDIAKKLLGDDYTEDWYPEEEQERDRRNMVISSYIASTTAALFWWVDG